MVLTDEQVLAQLKTRKIALRIELERVELAIKAFQKVVDVEYLDALPYMEDDIDHDDELAIASLLYNYRDSIEKKIQFILYKMKQGTAKEITQYLLHMDKRIKDSQMIYDRITNKASKLYRQGIINATKNGKLNIYSLKNQ